eukprot:TRINITY_DN55642_c0_g1_i1.p1 TRINITY_DN55642_c0_g1~~TRINITY_DN55642_c0_g1_i1.p1  ORF type:complete len:553 (+),score=87.89 TRINITY_DN55642_c0_g1_i1:20-1678(+)
MSSAVCPAEDSRASQNDFHAQERRDAAIATGLSKESVTRLFPDDHAILPLFEEAKSGKRPTRFPCRYSEHVYASASSYNPFARPKEEHGNKFVPVPAAILGDYWPPRVVHVLCQMVSAPNDSPDANDSVQTRLDDLFGGLPYDLFWSLFSSSDPDFDFWEDTDIGRKLDEELKCGGDDRKSVFERHALAAAVREWPPVLPSLFWQPRSSLRGRVTWTFFAWLTYLFPSAKQAFSLETMYSLFGSIAVVSTLLLGVVAGLITAMDPDRLKERTEYWDKLLNVTRPSSTDLTFQYPTFIRPSHTHDYPTTIALDLTQGYAYLSSASILSVFMLVMAAFLSAAVAKGSHVAQYVGSWTWRVLSLPTVLVLFYVSWSVWAVCDAVIFLAALNWPASVPGNECPENLFSSVGEYERHMNTLGFFDMSSPAPAGSRLHVEVAGAGCMASPWSVIFAKSLFLGGWVLIIVVALVGLASVLAALRLRALDDYFQMRSVAGALISFTATRTASHRRQSVHPPADRPAYVQVLPGLESMWSAARPLPNLASGAELRDGRMVP